MSHRFQKDMVLEILRQAELGTPLRELRRQYGFSEPSFYYWRAKFGRDSSDGGRTYLDLEAENRRLKILLAEAVCKLDASVSRRETSAAVDGIRN